VAAIASVIQGIVPPSTVDCATGDLVTRPHLKRILALGVAIAVALPFMDVVDPPDAGAALVFQDCLLVDDPIGGATLPEANDDINQVISEPGQVDVIRPLFETRWNRTLEVVSPGVLENDVARDILGNAEGGVLRAILYSAPSYGFVRMNDDGSFDYYPNAAFALQDRVDTFEYVAYDTRSRLCSEPATVSVSISGYDPGLPPGGAPDEYPAPGPGLSAAETLRVDSPGVLTNDLAGLDPGVNPGAGLEARLATQPVWEGTTTPAGTISDWGTRVDVQTGLTLADNSGGFSYTPSRTAFGTAVFTYRVCYRNRATVEAACSEPLSVRIRVERTTTAASFSLPWAQGRDSAFATVLYDDLLERVVFNSPTTGQLSVRVGAPAHGTATVFRVRDLNLFTGGRDPDEILAIAYVAGPSFSGTDQFTYRLCDRPDDTPETVCTNDATITVVPPPTDPAVLSVTPPTTTTGNVVVRFNRTVTGVSTSNATLRDVTDPDAPVSVPTVVRCAVEVIQNDFAGRPLIGPDGRVVVEQQSQSCDGTPGMAILDPVGSLTVGRTYEVGVNTLGAGIVSADERRVPVPAYDETFTLAVPDTTAPTAAPSATAPAGAWSRDDVTVTWNWSDGAGSGVDPSRCTSSTTSSGEGEQVLTATCTDLANNTATATYEVAVDRTPPASVVVASAAGWSNRDVTVQWNWDDGAGAGADPETCPASSTSSGEGVLTLSATCTDLAGNVSTASTEVRVDRTAPVLAPAVAPSRVWLNGSATGQPGASDALSGLASASCGAVDTSRLGARSLGCTATDLAGNVAVGNAAYTVDVGLRWVRRPTTVRRPAGSRVTASVQLLAADGRPIPAELAASLPPCAVSFTVGQQVPVCARYRRGNFEATITNRARLQRGSTVPLLVVVRSESTPVGIIGTQLVVK
jgi:hypothetical protein